MELQEERDELRAALVGIIGVDNNKELDLLEKMISVSPVPEEEKAVMKRAINILQKTRE